MQKPMATNDEVNGTPPVRKRSTKPDTEFQVHVSRQAIFDGIREKLYDFVEYRLLRLAVNSHPMQKLEIMALIQDYRNGKVAVAWRDGRPVWIPLDA